MKNPCTSSLLAAFLALGLGASPAGAADALTTDRPDFSESPEVVGAGRFQIETSVSGERSRGAGIKTESTSTPTLLRIGLTKSLELRLESDGLQRSTSRDTASGLTQRERGWSDLSVGMKWHAQDGDDDDYKPSIAWLVHVDVDSGSAAFRGQGLRPSLRMVAEWELPNELSLGIMPGVASDKNDDGRRFTAGLLAVALGKEWNAQWRSFAEIAVERLASKGNGGNLALLNVGSVYLVNNDLQLDASVSRGVTSNAPRWRWDLGLSARF